MENQTPKKNSNVIYFLIVVILALIGTDIYLFLKKKQTDNVVTVQSDQKTRLQSELDSLELQIEQVNAGKTRMTAALQAKNDSLRAKIRDLRIQLDKGKLTAAQLDKAKEDVKQLRYFVTKYTADIEDLRKKNEDLTSERDTLKTNLTTVKEKATTLEKQNEDLSSKVQIASALKIGSMNIKSFKVKDNGKESDNNRAAVVKKLKIEFTVASNPIAEKKLHDIFVRVIDPTGNLITSPESSTFQVEGQDLQYTYKAPIDFKDDGSGFTIDWINPNKFQKGVYTVLLYADGYSMGKSTVTLK